VFWKIIFCAQIPSKIEEMGKMGENRPVPACRSNPHSSAHPEPACPLAGSRRNQELFINANEIFGSHSLIMFDI
jgi:hypothetical protein